jgi:steroid 5-alpha reductase family enzyme
MTEIITMITGGSLLLLPLFMVAWLIQLKTKNAGVVHAAWFASFTVLTGTYFILSDGLYTRKLLIFTLVTVWSIHRAICLLTRKSDHKRVARNIGLCNVPTRKQNRVTLLVCYFRALMALLFSLPFMLIMINDTYELTPIELIGTAIWLIAIIGGTKADNQLRNFKVHPANDRKVCNVGLWHYSRHPNHFFEWLIWISFFIIALASPWGWLSIIYPMVILYLLLKETGIPQLEKQLINSKGHAYIDYQKTTSSFIPLPKRT